MRRLEIKNRNVILTEKQQKHQHCQKYRLKKTLININILQVNQRQIIEQAKFAFSFLGKSSEKQIKTMENQGIKQVKDLKALKPEENQELESIEGLFPIKMKINEIKNEIN